MAKFARYELGKPEPREIFEGDFMRCDGFYGKIFAGDEGDGEFNAVPPHLLCAIRLSGGQRIAEIRVPTNPEVPNPVPQATSDVIIGKSAQKKSAQKVRPLPKKSE
jgi:hypothetical protein